MARSAVQVGHDVDIISSNFRDQVLSGLNIFGISQGPLSRFTLPKALWATYRFALQRDADVYHVHEIPLMVVGLLLKCLHRKHVVVDFHEDFAAEVMGKEYLPRPLRHVIKLAYLFFNWLFLARFDGVILAEDSYAASSESIDNKIIVRNYPLANTVRFEPLDSQQRPEKIKLCYAGTIRENRDVLDLVNAVKRLNEAG